MDWSVPLLLPASGAFAGRAEVNLLATPILVMLHSYLPPHHLGTKNTDPHLTQ
jgi:hypothetical protein